MKTEALVCERSHSMIMKYYRAFSYKLWV